MADANGSSLGDVATFLLRLEKARIHFALSSAREGGIMVQVAVPGERWEIEFFPGRAPEVEVFRSDSNVGDAKLLEQLFNEHGD